MKVKLPRKQKKRFKAQGYNYGMVKILNEILSEEGGKQNWKTLHSTPKR